MHLYRLGELNLVLLNRYSLIRVPINESLLYYADCPLEYMNIHINLIIDRNPNATHFQSVKYKIPFFMK